MRLRVMLNSRKGKLSKASNAYDTTSSVSVILKINKSIMISSAVGDKGIRAAENRVYNGRGTTIADLGLNGNASTLQLKRLSVGKGNEGTGVANRRY